MAFSSSKMIRHLFLRGRYFTLDFSGSGKSPSGRLLEISFRIASFQLPSIFKTSGVGPGLRRLDFVASLFTESHLRC